MYLKDVLVMNNDGNSWTSRSYSWAWTVSGSGIKIIRTSKLDQPTNQKAKGGVGPRRETSSLIRFNHSCVLKALLEVANGALN
jgi:hypothetical protein